MRGAVFLGGSSLGFRDLAGLLPALCLTSSSPLLPAALDSSRQPRPRRASARAAHVPRIMLNITRSLTQQTDCTERKKSSLIFLVPRERALVLEQGIACTLKLRCEGVEAVALTCHDARSYSSW